MPTLERLRLKPEAFAFFAQAHRYITNMPTACTPDRYRWLMLDPSQHGRPMAHETSDDLGPEGGPGGGSEPTAEPEDRGGELFEATHHVEDRSPLPADPAPHEVPGPLQPLDPRWIITERISGVISAAVLAVGGLVAVLIFAGGWRAAGLGLWVLLAVGLFAAAIIAPALQYPHASYRVSAFGIEIRRGIFWRRVTIVPRSRIQHTDVDQGPLLRKFELAKLVIHTAGTEHSTVPLFGLAMADAVAIRDDLIGLHARGAPGEGASDGDGV